MVGLSNSSSAQVGNAPSASMAEAMLHIARIVPMPTERGQPKQKRYAWRQLLARSSAFGKGPTIAKIGEL